ncbi:hypothetical protein Dimus_031850 [Dionaea muscipula]
MERNAIDDNSVASAGAPRTDHDSNKEINDAQPEQIDPIRAEGDNQHDTGANVNQEKVEGVENADHGDVTQPVDLDLGLDQLLAETDRFILGLSHATTEDTSQPLEIPAAVEKFLKKVESRIDDYDRGESKFGQVPSDDSLFLDAVDRLTRLRDALVGFMSDSNGMLLLNLISAVLHRAMLFMEDDLRCLLEQSNPSSKNSSDPSSKPDQSTTTPDQSSEAAAAAAEEEETFPSYTTEAISSMNLLSRAMISAGYEAEVFNVFLITRRHALEEELKMQGFEKISIDDVQRMQWEPLQGEILTWISILKRCSGHLLPLEQKFYHSMFSDHHDPAFAKRLLSDIALTVCIRLVNVAEAVAMTKRSSEKLFRFLDMLEALRDAIPTIDKDSLYTKECIEELKTEFVTAGSRLGEAAFSIFCELENSIKSDNVKTPVPNGAVHPLTRYTMNYLMYACEYKDTLEQLFRQHQKTEQSQEYSGGGEGDGEKERRSVDNNEEQEKKDSPFTTRLMTILDLLDKNLEAKSLLYKDPSLRYIFLLNNGRYMLKNVRGSAEIHQVVGDPWCRKRSSDMRLYHKSYQRETWSRVLQCLNQEGLQVHGKVHKPVLKERFKNFNLLFDEIHKTQSTWVVSDDQLQSELRVSISAVMIPAYRSFFARFGQYFTPGRQTEKYIKYQPEDIEGVIDELFDGTTSSMARKRT